jgi:type IV pilus assembly protein PilC
MADEDFQIRFRYSARDKRGQIVSGVVLAETKLDAARRIKNIGLATLTLEESSTSNVRKLDIKDLPLPRPGYKVKPRHLAMFARQFSTMIDSGMPLVRGLVSLMDQTESKGLAEVLPLVRRDIEAGNSLSDAFKKHPKVFPSLMVGMTEAGELSGDMSGAMEQISVNYEKAAKLRSKVVSALTYPIIVLSLAVIMIIAMMIFVVPTFVEVFDSLGAELPLPTRILISISGSTFIWLPIFGVIIGGLIALWRRNKNNEAFRTVIDPYFYKIPVMGKFTKKIALARWSRTFASLLGSGVPITRALLVVKQTVNNQLLKSAMDDTITTVRSGYPVSSALMRHKVFPNMIVTMVSTGEESGSMPPMLNKIAEYYEQDVESTSESLGSLIEPILLVFMAGIVGGMVLALYLPIFSIYENLG